MTNGQLPFLGATENNNGITGFTDITTINQWSKTGNSTDNTLNKKKFGPNWLAVTNNGSVGNVYFMETTYTSSHDVTSLSLKNKDINKEIGLFLASILEEAGKPFSYGRKWRPKRMRTTPILLPLDKDKTPDWNYMEQYIVNIIKTIEVPKLEPIKTSNIDLNSVRWHEFKISDVMNILSGVRLTSSDMSYGSIPFIGASDSNNGITNWTSNTNSSTDSNVLGINYNGSVGEVFYHPYVATFSDDVKRLKLKQITKANKEVYLFIKTMLLQQKSKYAYGYKFNGTRMKAQKIMLPVTGENIPDWKFMEDYVKSISNSRLL